MYNFEPIGTVRCNFIEKFGIPRQPGLSPSSEAIIEFPNNRFFEDSIKDLEGNSHIWVIFIFSSLKKKPDKAKIRPPRLGGNKYVGVFSSRSPYRPNPIGLSLVKFSHISYTKENIRLHISDHDLLNGTPVLDIKPYTNADTPNCEVTFSWQESEWCNLEVSFSEEAEKFLFKKIKLRNQILELLQNDPRPAYHRKQTQKNIHGLTIGCYNVKFSIENQNCVVLNISLIDK